MFKSTGSSGRRNASGGGGVSRVSATQLNRVSEHPRPRTVAFQPESQQEHGFSTTSSRIGGLAK